MNSTDSDRRGTSNEAAQANVLKRRLRAPMTGAALLTLAGLAAIVIAHRAMAAIAVADRQTIPEACAAWDRSARKTLAAMPAGHTEQDARFRLRRAERNCAEGWLGLACADYLILRAGPPPAGDGKWYRLAVPISCRN